MTGGAIAPACECLALAISSGANLPQPATPPERWPAATPTRQILQPMTSECSDRDEQLLERGEFLEPCLRLGQAHEFPMDDQRDDEREQRA